jgi:Bacterial PH domain
VPPAAIAVAGAFPDTASLGLRRRDTAAMALVPLLFGLLALAWVLLAGPSVLLIVAALLLLLVAAAVFVRGRGMRFDVGPDGLTIVNFWRSRSIPWEQVAAVEMVDPPWRVGLAVAAAVAGQDIESGGRGIGVRVRKDFANPIVLPTIVASVTLDRDYVRDAGLREAVGVLHKQASAHAVPVALPLAEVRSAKPSPSQ